MPGISEDASILDGLREKSKFRKGRIMRAVLETCNYSEKLGACKDKLELKGKPDHIKAEMNVINIYPELTDQVFDGFGGAVTDASAKVLMNMPEKKRKEILKAYFGRKGNGYSLIRLPMDSCDFSENQYAAATDWKAGEKNSFEFSKEEELQIKLIEEIYAVAGDKLPVLLCPWSPPAAMKDNRDRIGGKLLRERYRDYADYMCNYITQLRKRGVNVSSVTIQNEQNAWQVWDSCLYTAEEELDFITNTLALSLREYDLEDIDIYLWDHNKERVVERALKGFEEAGDKVKGIAFHWYTGDHFEALRAVHERYPDKKLSHTEGCVELLKYGDSSEVENAVRYAHDILGDLENGTNSYYDWNIVLDEKGGPNYVDNFCDAPVIYDKKWGKVNERLSFHYIGMISRFVRPEAVRITSTSYDSDIDHTAFINKDGSIALVLLNRKDEIQKICCRMNGCLYEFEVEASGMASVLFTKK